MMFLERNGVAYLGPVYDPVFQATVKYLAVNPEVANQNRYRSNSCKQRYHAYYNALCSL